VCEFDISFPLSNAGAFDDRFIFPYHSRYLSNCGPTSAAGAVPSRVLYPIPPFTPSACLNFGAGPDLPAQQNVISFRRERKLVPFPM
jgi:hypothetical protein